MEPWIIIVLLGLGIILYTRLYTKNETQPVREKIIAEMEDTFEHFALEIESENKQVLEHMLSLKQQFDEQNTKLVSRVEFLEKRFLDNTAEAAEKAGKTVQSNISIVKRLNKPFRKSEIQKVEPPKGSNRMEIKQRYLELFQLYDEGKSVEYISKKLLMNKGEIQLILQLAEQEEQSSV